jgi:hypothetical protein
VNRTFKYSVIVVEQPGQEIIAHEIALEQDTILQPEDQLKLQISEDVHIFRIATVTKVDHIKAPNDQFDFRVIAVGI